MLETKNLAVGYGGRTIIGDVNVQLRPGEIVTLIGPNGAGKSTILKTIIRQLDPIKGTVYLDGRSMAEMGPQETARRLSVLMTDRVRPELMTCWDVVAAGRYPYTGRLGLLSPADREKVWETLELVHGEKLAGQDFTRISDGQRQRVLLARALCQEPEVLVLDEPTSFLDIRYKLELLSILKDMARTRKLAVLLSLHELELAQRISDYVLCVHNGTVERRGTPEEIFTGQYIMELYEADRGSYNPGFGCLELEPAAGEPQVFVIGGGGSGIPVYRRLQRQGIPFAAGVLHKNDADFSIAKALAVEVVAEQAFHPIGEEAFSLARARLDACTGVLCPLTEFGPVNEKNRILMELAIQQKKLQSV